MPNHKDLVQKVADRMGLSESFIDNLDERNQILMSETERNWRKSLKIGDTVFVLDELYGYEIQQRVNRVGRLNIQVGDNLSDTFRIETGRRSHGNVAMGIFSTSQLREGGEGFIGKFKDLKFPENPDLFKYV